MTKEVAAKLCFTVWIVFGGLNLKLFPVSIYKKVNQKFMKV